MLSVEGLSARDLTYVSRADKRERDDRDSLRSRNERNTADN